MPRKNTISPSLRRRAERIIRNRETDESTREAIRYNLERNDPDLPELVRRAETGETILDMVPAAYAPAEAAALLIKLMNHEGAPDWLADQIQWTLEEMAHKHRCLPLWKDASDYEEWDPRKIEELFTVSAGQEENLERGRLARAIVEIERNRHTPVELYNAVGGFVTEASNDLRRHFYESLGWVSTVLETVPKQDWREERQREEAINESE